MLKIIVIENKNGEVRFLNVDECVDSHFIASLGCILMSNATKFDDTSEVELNRILDWLRKRDINGSLYRAIEVSPLLFNRDIRSLVFNPERDSLSFLDD